MATWREGRDSFFSPLSAHVNLEAREAYFVGCPIAWLDPERSVDPFPIGGDGPAQSPSHFRG